MKIKIWDTAKVILRGLFIEEQAYLKKQEKSQIHSLTLYLKELDKKDQMKPRVSRRNEMITSQSRNKYIKNS